MKKVVSIAGSDSSGGAGIQADLKTFLALDTYGMSVITAITAQNTLGVSKIEEVSKELVEAQLDAIFTDIRPNAVKIGMVANAENIETIASKLKKYHATNIVIDPVMVSTSGHALLEPEAKEALFTKLLGLADLITPNVVEAEELSRLRITSKDDMMVAATIIHEQTNASVLIKGGHLPNCADDLLLVRGSREPIWFCEKYIKTKNTHGTGCTLSSAIAAYLAKGNSMEEAIRDAKSYLTNALASGLEIGHGNGPIDHGWRR